VPIPSATILVVDDDPATRALLVEALAEEGYAVRTAPDGAGALAQVAAGGIGLVLLDLKMPGLDGFAVCRALRARAATAELPIIVLSVLMDDYSQQAAFAAGANHYLTKPFDLDDLLAWLRTWFTAAPPSRESGEGGPDRLHSSSGLEH